MSPSARREGPFYLKITRKLSSFFSFGKSLDFQSDDTTRSNDSTKSVNETYLEKRPKNDSLFSSSPASGSVINGNTDQETSTEETLYQPLVTLDITLQDLYALDNNLDEVVLVYALPSANIQMTSSITLSTKYAYQAPLEWTDDIGRLARMNLQVVPQFFGFLAGKMDVVLFDLEDEGMFHREDARQIYKHLIPAQQPLLRFVEKPQDIVLPPGAKIAVIGPMDCLSHFPHVVDPDVHYEVQSKRGLAVSGIPTPSSEFIDTTLRPDQVNATSLVDVEVVRMTKPITTSSPPFVVKMPQSVSGQGTWVVRSEACKQNALNTITQELPKLLQQKIESNQHLNPSSLVLQEMIAGEALALSLFITKTGRPIFLGCCRQYIDVTGHWAGGFISYEEQEDLEREHAGIAEDVAKYCRRVGFYGPMGVDVMTDDKNKKLVIDPNARIMGTTPLCLLKQHFATRRMKEAVIFFPVFLSCTRDEFAGIFASEYQDGSLIIVGWCHDRREGKQVSVAALIMGAENQNQLSEFINRLNSYKIDEEG